MNLSCQSLQVSSALTTARIARQQFSNLPQFGNHHIKSAFRHSVAEEIVSSFLVRFALSLTLLGIAEIDAAAANCGDFVDISHSEDYLVNLRSVIESDCLQDASKIEKVLSTAFSTDDIRLTYRDDRKVNYSVNITPDKSGRTKNIAIKIALRTDGTGETKVFIDAYFPETASITHHAFLEKWPVTSQPSLRSPHLPPNLSTFRYTLSGRHPGVVAVTTNEKNLLTSLSYEEK